MPRKKAQIEEPNEAKSSVAVAEQDGETAFAQLAQQHWLKPSTKKSAKVKVKQDVLKNEIWDILEKKDFAFSSLLSLENLQVLEKYRRLLGLPISC